jgi:prepilin-type N-terminal cleavage/methylation domain-containing protein
MPLRGSRCWRGGFTLLEVVVALVILEVGVLGAAGTLLLASRTLTRAERLERAVAYAAAVLDSLSAGARPGAGARAHFGGEVRWSVDSTGAVKIAALAGVADTLLAFSGVVPAVMVGP